MTASPLRPGREADAVIAEQVMGWPRIGDTEPFSRFVECGGVITSSGAEVFRQGIVPYPWCPSTDMTAAMQVVEKMRCTDEAPDERFWVFTDCATLGWSADYRAVLTENDADVSIASRSAPTLPHAICLTALAAFGVTIPAQAAVVGSAPRETERREANNA